MFEKVLHLPPGKVAVQKLIYPEVFKITKTQVVFICSKSKIETPVKVHNSDTNKVINAVLVSLLTLNRFHISFWRFYCYFEHVNASWEDL